MNKKNNSVEELILTLSKYPALSEHDINLVVEKAQLRVLKKGDYFLKNGKIAKELGFVTDGILRVCYLTNQGEDITKAFITENNFALNILSFNNKTPSEVDFKVVTDCKILFFSKKDLNDLAAEIPCWKDLFLEVSADALINKLKISNNMLIQDAATRYLEFLKIYPGLANRISLSSLASYLGIKQSTLSRIRKKLI